jgi:hypothetical protein
MAGEGCLILDMFDMVKHDPSCLKVTTKLHPLDQIKSTHISINIHFEDKRLLSKLLFYKFFILDIIITTIGLERYNVRDVPSVTRMLFIKNNKVSDIGKTKGCELIHHLT